MSADLIDRHFSNPSRSVLIELPIRRNHEDGSAFDVVEHLKGSNQLEFGRIRWAAASSAYDSANLHAPGFTREEVGVKLKRHRMTGQQGLDLVGERVAFSVNKHQLHLPAQAGRELVGVFDADQVEASGLAMRDPEHAEGGWVGLWVEGARALCGNESYRCRNGGDEHQDAYNFR